MEREIKFRGKCIDSGKFIFGNLLDNGLVAKNKFFILANEANNFDEYEEVNSESIGQFTGLHDKNGVEIYEGDIINFRANYTNKPCGYFNGVVKITPYKLILVVGDYLEYDASEEAEGLEYNSEVIGTIHDKN